MQAYHSQMLCKLVFRSAWLVIHSKHGCSTLFQATNRSTC